MISPFFHERTEGNRWFIWITRQLHKNHITVIDALEIIPKIIQMYIVGFMN